MKMAKKWLITTLIMFLAMTILFGAYLMHSDIEMARGNPYVAEHIIEEFLYSLHQATIFGSIATLTVGQILFWLIELLRKTGIIKHSITGIKYYFLMGAGFVAITLFLIIATIPLWFRLP